jgi:hypothetical protein
MSKDSEDLNNSYQLITNNQYLDLEIKEKNLTLICNLLYKKVIESINNNGNLDMDDFDLMIHMMKIKDLVQYIVLQNITSVQEFHEDMRKLILYSRIKTYEDEKIHDAKALFNIIQHSLFET